MVRSIMTTTSKPDLAELAANIVRCFPSLNVLEQGLSLDLYRLLAEGQPVQRMELAQRLGTSVEAVNRILENWPGVLRCPRADCGLLGSVHSRSLPAAPI